MNGGERWFRKGKVRDGIHSSHLPFNNHLEFFNCEITKGKVGNGKVGNGKVGNGKVYTTTQYNTIQ